MKGEEIASNLNEWKINEDWKGKRMTKTEVSWDG